MKTLLQFCLLALTCCTTSVWAQKAQDSGWPNYANDAGGTRYSTAAQINRDNVTQLRVAWTFRTGSMEPPSDLDHKAAFETTPILVAGKLFLTTPRDQVIAVNPLTGAKLWEYDPKLDLTHEYSEVSSRGVSAWTDTAARRRQPCGLRIFVGTLDARLIALDGETGNPCADFGSTGVVDLTKDVDFHHIGNYQVTSAPAIVKDIVITGSSIADNGAVDLERGIVRGFDARSGKLRWTWDPIPWAMKTQPRTGAGNAWSTISSDAAHDLVFVPTGSASPDYFGGIRKGDNKWANSVVALRASTGEFVWGFQVVHHDLWDFDVASQPTLFNWKDGTPAIAIATKMGRVFVLNRMTGAPLIPVVETPVPKSDTPGDEAWPTQPSSISVVPEKLSAEEAWGLKPEERQWCADKIKASRSEGIFTPPSVQGTIVYPGNVGGVNWGSAAYDPQRHLLIMDTNHLAMWVKLIPRDEFSSARRAATEQDRLHGEFAPQSGTPYGMFRTPLLSASGVPCNAPPWGTVAAVDLFTGKKAWDVPLGTMVPGMMTGSITLGGPIATAGGLIFTAATMDNFVRAFDSESGKSCGSLNCPQEGRRRR